MSELRYLYLGPQLDQACVLSEPALDAAVERQSLVIRRGAFKPRNEIDLSSSSGLAGVIFEMADGWPRLAHLRAARKALAAGQRAFFYWPREQAVEPVDGDRLRSHRVLSGVVWLTHLAVRVVNRLGVSRLVRSLAGLSAPANQMDVGLTPDVRQALLQQLDQIQPASLQPALLCEAGEWRVTGRGVYLRTDYWNPITSGGSYGHTCHVAQELAHISDELICLMANRFPLLDEMGLHQVVVRPPYEETSEPAMLAANEHLYLQLRAAVAALRPAYLYERAVLGSYVGARLAAELGIPYLLEYNGSEISIQKSFGTTRYEHEQEFLRIEAVAFRQAAVISVISEPVKADLLARGVSADKILVNPNGVDLASYCPAMPDDRDAIRKELGFGPEDRVIGFTGTFGGWHGIDTLAAALPLIAGRCSRAKVLLIGDGHMKAVVDQTIHDHALWDVVHCTGRVPQQEGARLLKACDICIAPHNSHMVDGKFFGSPTKLFEYMGMGAGIVASDLEQMGEVLRPAIQASELPRIDHLDQQRAVLCEPGNLQQFVDSVVFLCEHPQVCEHLGRRAREAAESTYAWSHHVQRLLGFAAAQPAVKNSALQEGDVAERALTSSHGKAPGVRESPRLTLDEALEMERHRYSQAGQWMPALLEFERHSGEDVLEVGAGLGTDLVQFARHGARVTEVDTSPERLGLARENFRIRGLNGNFVLQSEDRLPFQDAAFDLVYASGGIQQGANVQQLVDEIHRVLRPGGQVIAVVCAENSLRYWRNLVLEVGLGQAQILNKSMGAILAEAVEVSESKARPVGQVYTRTRLKKVFSAFQDLEVTQCHLARSEVPPLLGLLPLTSLERWMGWYLVIKARKSRG